MSYSNRQRGIAIVIVIWVMTLIVIIAGSYSLAMRTESASTSSVVRAAKARALTEGGVWLGIHALLKPLANQSIRGDGAVQTVQIAGQIVHVAVQDLGGLIDLNSASRELLAGLMRAAGVERSLQETLVDRIIDWRDRDSEVSPRGAEDDTYRAAGFAYGAKDAPFNTVDELQRVMGVTASVYRAVESMVTVGSGYPGIRADTAPREVLLAVPGLSVEFVDRLLEGRGTAQFKVLMSLLPHTARPYLSLAPGRNYRVRAEATIEGTTARVTALVELGRSRKRPFILWSWQEGGVPLVASLVAGDSSG